MGSRFALDKIKMRGVKNKLLLCGRPFSLSGPTSLHHVGVVADQKQDWSYKGRDGHIVGDAFIFTDLVDEDTMAGRTRIAGAGGFLHLSYGYCLRL